MSITLEALKPMKARKAPQVYQAGLIFTDESDVAIAQLTYPILAVMQAFGQEAQAEPELDFDCLRVKGSTLDVQAQIFDAPEADPDTLSLVRDNRNSHLDAESRAALESPTFWLHLTITERTRAEGQHPEASKAMLAELLHHCIAATGAPFVQWLNADTVLTSHRFQTAFSPILMPSDEEIDELEDGFMDAEAAPQAAGAFPAIEEKALDARFAALREEARNSVRRSNSWVGTDPARVATRSMRDEMASLAEVFRTEPEVEEEEERPLEARLATWTVNATVAILNPPVAASLFAYNLVKGEDFRLSTHALTLTAVFAGLSTSAANAAAYLPF